MAFIASDFNNCVIMWHIHNYTSNTKMEKVHKNPSIYLLQYISVIRVYNQSQSTNDYWYTWIYTERVVFLHLAIMTEYYRFHDKNFLGNHKCTASHYIKGNTDWFERHFGLHFNERLHIQSTGGITPRGTPLALISEWICNYSHYIVYDELIHPFLNFNATPIGIWK